MKKIIVKNVDVPQEAMAHYEFKPLDYTDAFRVRLSAYLQLDMKELAYRIFGNIESYPGYVRFLLQLRDVLVRPLGLKTAADMEEITDQSEWIGFFRIYQRSENEIIIGADDKHLDVRVSCLRSFRDHQTFLTVSTFVRNNNLLGELYFAVIKPFHRIIVPSTMKRCILNMRESESQG